MNHLHIETNIHTHYGLLSEPSSYNSTDDNKSFDDFNAILQASKKVVVKYFVNINSRVCKSIKFLHSMKDFPLFSSREFPKLLIHAVI